MGGSQSPFGDLASQLATFMDLWRIWEPCSNWTIQANMHLALKNRETSYFEKSRFIGGAALDSLLVMKDDTDLVIVVIDSLIFLA